jgi:transglutaminase-like putative cysteine protease
MNSNEKGSNFMNLTYKNRKIIALITLIGIIYPTISLMGIAIISEDENLFGSESEKNTNISNSNPLSSALSNSGVDNCSGYSFPNNVTYEIEYKWQIRTTTSDTFKFWISRFPNHSQPQFVGVPPIQETILVENVTDGPAHTYIYDAADDYNNTYEYFSVPMTSSDDWFNYTLKYNVTLRETSWNVDNSKVGTYNVGDPWYQNLTGAETCLETGDFDLITRSNTICAGLTDIKDKAKAIYDWIVANIVYEIDLGDPSDKGAAWAYANLKGDCSEFSDLMVTLLRIQGIPARKMVGLSIVKGSLLSGYEPFYNPSVGDTLTWKYNKTSTSSPDNDIPGHAWMEYYIPNYGWITCDPTWGQSGLNFFNRIDYVHLATSIGENIGGGINPSLLNGIKQEFPISPYFFGYNLNQARWILTITLTVIDTEFSFDNNLWMFISIILIVSVIGIVLWAVTKNKKNK